MEIKGAVVFVTGASSGIGAAFARAAAHAGAKVVLVARREDKVRQIAKELGNAIAVRCDVTDAEQVKAAVRKAIDAFGRIDVLVNSAGQGLQAPIDGIKPGDFRDILELNVMAPLVTMQAVIPFMRKQGSGSIVNISSGIWFRPLPDSGAYSASKAALSTLSGVARVDLADANIAVSTMYPFITATDFVNSIKAGRELAEKLEGPISSQRQQPEQVADKILELIKTGAAQADLVPEQYGGSYKG